MQNIAKACGNTFGLMQGNAPEISGGLLIALPREQVYADTATPCHHGKPISQAYRALILNHIQSYLSTDEGLSSTLYSLYG